MTDTSQAGFSFVPATTFGVTPATPVFQSLRFLTETLTPQVETLISNEVRADAEVSEVRRSGMTASGEATFELHRNANLEALLAAGVRGTWNNNVCKSGLEKPHFTFERKIEAGATDYYLRFEGGRVNGFTLNIAPEEFVTGSLKLMTAGHTASPTMVTGATYPGPTGINGIPMTGVDVSSLAVGGAPGVDFLGLTIEVDLAMRQQRKIGQQALRGLGYGRRTVTGTLRAYFEDLTAYNMFMADEASSIVTTISDGDNTFGIALPRIKFTGGDVPNPGNDQDFILAMTYQATFDPTLACSIQLTRSA